MRTGCGRNRLHDEDAAHHTQQHSALLGMETSRNEQSMVCGACCVYGPGSEEAQE